MLFDFYLLKSFRSLKVKNEKRNSFISFFKKKKKLTKITAFDL